MAHHPKPLVIRKNDKTLRVAPAGVFENTGVLVTLGSDRRHYSVHISIEDAVDVCEWLHAYTSAVLAGSSERA